MDLLVVGLDGLSTNMLDRFDIEPSFISQTRAEGVSGELMSVDTPTTLPAWTSFATGKDPGTHGLTNMIRQSPDYDIGPFETNTSEAAIYDLIDDAVFVNLPASIGRDPAAEDTHLVSAMLARDKADAVPRHMQSLSAYEGYILDHDKGLKSRPDRYFEHVCEITRRRRDFAIEAFETYEPRVGFVLFSTPDWAGHLLSNFSSDEERASYYQQLLEVVDNCVEDVAGMADNVVLMSDHGFEKKTHNVHLNEWLRDRGYLTEMAGDAPTGAASAVWIAKAVATRSNLLYEAMRRVYNYIIGTRVGQGLQEAAKPDIDYSRSLAWQLRYGCVYLNNDRFDHSQVDDPEALAAQLRDEIGSIIGPDGNPAFRDVLLGDEAYTNPGPMAPDIVARPAPGRFPTMLDSPTGQYVSRTNNYNHRYRGFFAATGPLFTSEAMLNGMSIVDVLPTLLHALDEPLPDDLNGTVRQAALTTDGSPRVEPADQFPAPRVTGEDDASAQNERDAAVEARLQDLGYMN